MVMVIRTHMQAGGELVASATLDDGRVIRVVGLPMQRRSMRYSNQHDIEAQLRGWIAWERNGRQR